MLRYSPAILGLFVWLTPLTADELPPRIQDSIAYLKALQTPSGGYRNTEPKKGVQAEAPTLRATTSAIRAIRYFGGAIANQEASRRFVASCFDDKTGGFANTPGGKADVFSTAIGAMAVASLGMPLEQYRQPLIEYLSEHARSFGDIRIAAAGLESLKATTPKAKTWLAAIRKMANNNGTFGKDGDMASKTGQAGVAILRLGGELQHRANVLKAIRAGQQDCGAYGAGDSPHDGDLHNSYYVLRLFHMLGEQPSDPEALRTFIEKCRNTDGGYSNVPDGPSSVSATYYAAIMHHWLKEEK